MSFDLVEQIKIVNAHSNVDKLYGPYRSLSEALSEVPIVLRVIGRTVGIVEDDVISEYWFKEGVDDSDLILKSSDAQDLQSVLNEGNEVLNSSIFMEVDADAFESTNNAFPLSVSVDKALIKGGQVTIQVGDDGKIRFVGSVGSNTSNATYNIVYGGFALHSLTRQSVTDGSDYNSAFGSSALRGLITGSRNTALGSYAGLTLTTGSRNIFIGSHAGYSVASLTGVTWIGNYRGMAVDEGMVNSIIISDGRDATSKAGVGFMVIANGTTTVPRQTIETIDNDLTGKSVITKEWIIANIPTLQEVLTKGNVTDKFINIKGSDVLSIALRLAIISESIESGGVTNSKLNKSQFTIYEYPSGYLDVSTNIYNSTIPTANVYFGQQALFSLSKLGADSSVENTAFGNSVLNKLTGGEGKNTAFGSQAGLNLTTGARNTLIGYHAGRSLTTGGSNTIIGNIETVGTNISNTIILSDGTSGIGRIGFKVTEDGTTTIPQQTIDTIEDDATGKAVITKEYLLAFIPTPPDLSPFALKVITITGTGDLTGGGSLDANRTIDLSTASKTKLNNGATAYSWGDHSGMGYASQTWVQAQGYLTTLPDLTVYALKTITVGGTGALTGGGNLSANRTIDLSTTSKASLANGNTAYGWGNHSIAGYLKNVGLTEDYLSKLDDNGDLTNSALKEEVERVHSTKTLSAPSFIGKTKVETFGEAGSCIPYNLDFNNLYDKYIIKMDGCIAFDFINVPDNTTCVTIELWLQGTEPFSFPGFEEDPYSEDPLDMGKGGSCRVILSLVRSGINKLGSYQITNFPNISL